jgi:hypothetical protein
MPGPYPQRDKTIWEGATRRPRFIESQRLGDFCIPLIGVAVDIGKSLPVRIHDLEAAV